MFFVIRMLFTPMLKRDIVGTIVRMKNEHKNTDGIFLRRQNLPRERRTLDRLTVPSRYLADGEQPVPPAKSLPPVLSRRQNQAPAGNTTLDRSIRTRNPVRAVDIDLSLDDAAGRRKKKHKFWPPTKKFWKRFGLASGLVVLIVAGYFGWKIISNASKIFQGNIFNAVASVVSPDKPLKADQLGNTNVLLMGTSESDPGHPGAQLTDSMMIVSFNQTKHTAFLLSIPRDLWVRYASACSVGYEGKINAAYECALNNADGANNGDELQAERTVAGTVGDVFGMDIQYVAHLNLAVVQKAVDAVGGVDITIDSPDPRGILDRNFDWRCNYKCYLVKYPNGPAHLDVYHAMWLAQARNDSGGYGLPRGNFDRENNQRKILVAVEKKALSVGFLANPLNVTNLLDALGDNVHTTIDSSEIKTFIDVAKAIPPDSIASIDIINDAPSVLTTGAGPDGSSIVRPVAGIYDYSGIATFTKKLLNGGASLLGEGAKVDVLNGSGVSGAAATEADTLEQSGFTIGTVDSAPDSFKSTATYTLYDLSKGGKPNTLAALKKKLGVSTTQTTLPAGVTSTASFVVILGQPKSTDTSSGQ